MWHIKEPVFRELTACEWRDQGQTRNVCLQSRSADRYYNLKTNENKAEETTFRKWCTATANRIYLVHQLTLQNNTNLHSEYRNVVTLVTFSCYWNVYSQPLSGTFLPLGKFHTMFYFSIFLSLFLFCYLPTKQGLDFNVFHENNSMENTR